MERKVLAGSSVAAGLLGLGMLVGSVMGAGSAFAQTPSGTAAAPAAQVASTPVPGAPAPQRGQGGGNGGAATITAKISQADAEKAALAANPGSTVDHTFLQNQNGSPVYDVDFTNGGGALVDGNTGAIITNEAPGTDIGGRGGHGGPGGRGGVDQAALAAKATVSQQDAEAAALKASPGNTVDHSSLMGDPNGTVFWDVDFANGGGVEINAQTGAVIKVEAAGTDMGGGPHGNHPAPPASAPSTTP